MNLKEYYTSLLKLQNKIYSPITINDVIIDIIEVDFENTGSVVFCPPHTHTWFEFNYVTSGQLLTNFGAEMYKAGESMFFLIPPGMEHSHRYKPGSPHDGIYMRWQIIKNEDVKNKESGAVGFNQLECLYEWNIGCYKDDGNIGTLLEQMLKHASYGASTANLQLDFINILFMLSNLVLPDRGDRNFDKDIAGKTLLRKVDTYINDINQDTFDVHTLAASLHMSYGHLARTYKKYSGQTIHERLSTILVQKSLLLLEQTDFTIKEISEKLGYSNQYYFSRVFKEKKGMSPSEYRNLLRC
jgi:AraC-like DNA-binding protein